MKIGIDCRLINKVQNTGISRYTEFLIEYYINRFGSSSISLITNDKGFEYYDCTIIYTVLRPYNLFDFIRFSKFVNTLGYDLLHVPFYSGFYKKAFGTKVIVTVHDLMYHFVEGFFGKNKILNFLKIKYFDYIVKRSLENSDIIVSVSQTTKKDVFETFGFNSIHIPEDSEVSKNSDLNILSKHNLQDKGFFFYCGNNRPHKNIDFIVQIFNSNQNLPTLVLVGKGHNSSVNVLAIGIVSEEELAALYESAIAFVFPSKYEGFGLPVLEALRSKTCVIASKIPAFLEFKTENVLFFELQNEKEFMTAVKKSLSSDFIVDELFLEIYDKKNIYELYDMLLK